MDPTTLIAELEKEYSQRKQAEAALERVADFCENYFKYGIRTEANNTRYGHILEAVENYFKTNKGDSDGDI